MSGITNMLPDHISCFQVTGALLRKYGMKVLSEIVPEHLLPRNFQVRITELLHLSLASPTFASYSRHWEMFNLFVLVKLEQTLCVPVPVDWVALYVVHLKKRNLQVATIQTVLSATYANNICDLQDPTDNFLTSKLLLSIGQKT